MLHLLKRHPLPVRAHFRYSLVLTYALPRAVLEPLLPPGLELDFYEDFGFVAIALVQTENLRPAFLPAAFGQNFFLSGYRIFTRYTTRAGRHLRGLRILRSDTNRRLIVRFRQSADALLLSSGACYHQRNRAVFGYFRPHSKRGSRPCGAR